jgi:hypothetical protein
MLRSPGTDLQAHAIQAPIKLMLQVSDNDFRLSYTESNVPFSLPAITATYSRHSSPLTQILAQLSPDLIAMSKLSKRTQNSKVFLPEYTALSSSFMSKRTSSSDGEVGQGCQALLYTD